MERRGDIPKCLELNYIQCTEPIDHISLGVSDYRSYRRKTKNSKPVGPTELSVMLKSIPRFTSAYQSSGFERRVDRVCDHVGGYGNSSRTLTPAASAREMSHWG